MTKERICFLKLLKKYGTLTAPEICKKLKIEKPYPYSTDYSELSKYIQWPSEEGIFNDCFTVEHFNGDEKTSEKSKFTITPVGLEVLKKEANIKKKLKSIFRKIQRT